MVIRTALLSLLIVVIGWLIYFIAIRKVRNNNKTHKEDKRWAIFVTIGNLLLASGTYAVSLWAIYLTSGGNNMNAEQGQQIFVYAQIFGVIVLLLFGTMIGLLIDIFRGHKDKLNNTNNKTYQNPVLVDKQKHNDTLQYIKEQRQAKAELDKFLNDLDNEEADNGKSKD
jgi:heme/copper-type cytochrome/quinol oxidase subunit 2